MSCGHSGHGWWANGSDTTCVCKRSDADHLGPHSTIGDVARAIDQSEDLLISFAQFMRHDHDKWDELVVVRKYLESVYGLEKA